MRPDGLEALGGWGGANLDKRVVGGSNHQNHALFNFQAQVVGPSREAPLYSELPRTVFVCTKDLPLSKSLK